MKQRWLCAAVAAMITMGAASASTAFPFGTHRTKAATSTPATDLAGVWQGTYGMMSAALYQLEMTYELQFMPDGTYTATAKRNTGGNNVAKAFTETGTAFDSGSNVILKSSKGSQIVLRRSGNTLYGVAQDPQTERDVMVRLDKIG